MNNNHIDGIKIYRSILGSTLSIIFFVVLAMYTLFKFESLLKYNDTNIMLSSQENYFSEEDIFKGGKDKFNVAFGLIDYDLAEQEADYSEFGSLKVKLKQWSSDFVGT